MARELRTVMNEDVDWMDDIAERVESDVQPVFKRYMEANEDERADMEVSKYLNSAVYLVLTNDLLQTRFKMAKTHFRLQCRNEWYDYRFNALESVQQVIEEHHQGVTRVGYDSWVPLLPTYALNRINRSSVKR